ncbi:Probable signal protein [gamma proteobacterium HdN1]|nr:Probable signal protein [gamma proteobacterium HdN1]
MVFVGLPSLLLLAVLCFAGAGAHAATPRAELAQPPSVQLRYLLDADHSLNISAILANPDILPWQAKSAGSLGLGFRDGAVWLRVDVQSASNIDDWLLVVEFPLLRALDVFVVRAGVLDQVFQTGDRFEFAARPIEHRNFVFPIQISAQNAASTTLYLRIETPYSMVFPVYFAQADDYLQGPHYVTWLFGILCGIQLGMALYHLLVFAFVRDISYLFYALFAPAILLVFTAQQGFGYQYLWPEAIWWQQKAMLFGLLWSVAIGSVFVISFLRIHRHRHNLFIVLLCQLFAIAVCALLAIFVDSPFLVEISHYLIMFAASFCLWCGIVLLREGLRDVRFFVAALMVLVTATVPYCLSALGYIDYSSKWIYGMEIGAAIQSLLLGVALADRSNRERRLRLMREEEIQGLHVHIDQLQERAQEREEGLEKRMSRKLEEQSRELHEALEVAALLRRKLESISQLDEVTGLRNQNYFFELLHREWDRALREQRELSLMVIELDDFYEIGERYSVVIQEECLKVVAKLLQDTFSRPADVVVRYGDKVFGVLLPETGSQGARQLANILRSKIRDADYDFGFGKITLSLSVGIATCKPSAKRNFKDMLETAESALYVAHSNGGGQVQHAATLA